MALLSWTLAPWTVLRVSQALGATRGFDRLEITKLDGGGDPPHRGTAPGLPRYPATVRRGPARLGSR